MNKSSFAILAMLAAGMLAVLGSPDLAAQNTTGTYPSRPVTIISPYVPGAVTDKDGRVWSQKLTQALGKPFVLDFKPGAGSTIGTHYVAKAAPDGHTLLIITSGFTVTAAMYKDLPYDPLKDLAPVSLTAERPVTVLINPRLPIRNFVEYTTYARAHPNELNFGTSGAGSILHMAGAWMHSATGTEVTFVHYKGSAPMLVDLVAGRVDAAPSNIFNAMPFISSGKLRPIAIASATRSQMLPGIRTVAEQGIPGYGYSAWGGLLSPAGVPAVIINKLSGEIAKYVKEPDVIEKLTGDGTVLIGSTPEAFRQTLVTEITRWKGLAQQFNIKAADD